MDKEGHIILRTDKYEIHINPERTEVKFYLRTILLDQIVRSKAPRWTLRRSDFKHYPEAWQALVGWLQLWA